MVPLVLEIPIWPVADAAEDEQGPATTVNRISLPTPWSGKGFYSTNVQWRPQRAKTDSGGEGPLRITMLGNKLVPTPPPAIRPQQGGLPNMQALTRRIVIPKILASANHIPPVPPPSKRLCDVPHVEKAALPQRLCDIRSRSRSSQRMKIRTTAENSRPSERRRPLARIQQGEGGAGQKSEDRNQALVLQEGKRRHRSKSLSKSPIKRHKTYTEDEDLSAWVLKVQLLSGKEVAVLKVNELTKIKDIQDAVIEQCRKRGARVDLLVDSRLLPNPLQSLRELDLANIRTMSAILSRNGNVYCPRCRCRANSRQRDKFARMVAEDKRVNPAHRLGLHFADPNVEALISSFNEGQSVWDCFDNLQVKPIDTERWNRSGHRSTYDSIFKDTDDYGEEHNKWSKLIIHAMNDNKVEFAYWRASSKQNSLFTVACKKCKYFMHTQWSKGARATELKEIWWAWLVAEPDEFLGYDRLVLSPNSTAQSSMDAGRRAEETPNASNGTSSSHGSRRRAEQQDGDCRVDVDEPPSLPRRCALEARSHFPPTMGPEDEENDEEISPAPDLIDLTQRTQQCKLWRQVGSQWPWDCLCVCVWKHGNILMHSFIHILIECVCFFSGVFPDIDIELW